MTGNAILYRMPAGFAGDVTRKSDSTLEPNLLGVDAAPGAPVKMSAGKVVPMEAGDAASALYGFLARTFPTQGGISGLTAEGKLRAGNACDVLRRGYMCVTLARGTAAKGGQVHLRIAVAAAKAVGELEAAAVANETVALPATYTGPADSDGNVEIAYNI